MACLLFLQFLLRFSLYQLNPALTANAAADDILQSFIMGARFDLRMAAYALLPCILLPVIRVRIYVGFCRLWLTVFALGYVFFGIVEIEFYAEFQQRLNGLVFQYVSEDPATVLSMLWHGLPVLTYLGLFAASGYLILRCIKWLFRQYQSTSADRPARLVLSIVCVVALLLVSVICTRGTFRTGPPLRWGDAYVTNNLFLNQLALNGSFTLITAGLDSLDRNDSQDWLTEQPSIAEARTKKMLFVTSDQNTSSVQRPIGRISNNHSIIDATPKNVIIVLMESFAAAHVGSMGGKLNVTPSFDALTEEGILFERFFSNGTHTHQGMFATLSCFPNLPGHEYLMQQPEGRQKFSGLATLLPDHQKLFVYNGDFSWDNQKGFFANQGFDKFIGRDEYVDPIHIDPVWGVSDQDMFNRGLVELDALDPDKPFVAVLQTLSNHLPYSLPAPLPMEPVLEDGVLNERLTAMKYADWALGEFMQELKQKPYFQDTLVVLVGDHGFGTERQLTKVNLLRFHVPLLLISPLLNEHRGMVTDIVGSQVDIVPTTLGLMGKSTNNQCWGRNLFNLPDSDPGFAIIKPSGSDLTVAMVSGNKIITYEPETGSNLYSYALGPLATASEEINPRLETDLRTSLQSFVQTALLGLEANRMSAE
jgi:phosphoglycerol transferase MdoB-like AlkP superfamily enzyme